MDKVELYLQGLLVSLNIGNWALNFSLVLAITLLLQLMWRGFTKRTQRIIDHTDNHWDDIVWYALSRPMNWLILLMGGSMGLRVIAESEQLLISDYLPVVQKISILLLIGWIFLRLVNKAELVFIGHDDKDTTTVTAFAKLAKLSILVIISLSIIQTLGVSISGVLAFGGMGGLVVGMAAKDLLSNLFGALMVYMDKPFKVGDWIRSPDKSIEGTVEAIGWRITRIRTFDKRPLYVPNSLFTQIVVENASRMSNRRIKETFALRYSDMHQVEDIIEAVRQMLVSHPDIDQGQTLIVNFDLFNNSSLDFFIYTFTKTTDWVLYHKIKQDVLLKVANIVESHQAQFAFPTRQLHITPPIKEVG
ncbi:mechanosensitive ion channel family protein [Psychromonas antarctica]|jgi:MscS family membrane protein|uniref:mechanosensitive ion channel family protein n=1 Tax=Psychromonas antarctica TaxID=67573 RepID=UPI001EE917E7|nr:mechanosensitive ion channel family protein [Psychromonas antarctica]MCG6200122.1 mechanosensitive ion channel family protein [Psychromonas antarctica]